MPNSINHAWYAGLKQGINDMHCEVCSLRNLLVMNHFPTIFPPDTGGVLRYFHIYHQLSQCYDITLLSQKFTPKVEVIHYSDTFREFRMPVEDAHYRITEQLKSEGTGPEFSTHAALCCASSTNLHVHSSTTIIAFIQPRISSFMTPLSY